MSYYLAQFSYTGQAWAGFAKNPEDRTATVKKLAEAMGGQVLNFFYSFGDYDGVLLLDMPDDTSVEAFVIAANTPGHLRSTKITKLLTSDEATAAMHKAGSVTYRGPATG